MKIGVISDTHDHVAKIKQAVDIFNRQRVDFLVHAGDFIAPFSLNPFAKLTCDWRGVFGNNDGEREGLIKKCGGKIEPPPIFVEFAGKTMGVVHQFAPVAADIIICGHTHEPRIEQQKDKLIINPGEVCGWLTTKSSLVILDLDNLKPELVYF